VSGELEDAAAKLGERIGVGRPVPKRDRERRLADLLQQLRMDLDQVAVLG
jgi:hypothetical protein